VGAFAWARDAAAGWFGSNTQPSERTSLVSQGDQGDAERVKEPTPEQKNFQKLWGAFVDSFTASTLNGGFPQRNVEPKAMPPTFLPAVKRLVAIGDIHGDYGKAVKAFQLAGLIDENLNWVGGKAVAVQMGDVLDRGGDELKAFYFLERIQKQAKKHGGNVYVLNGNHEIMNVSGRFRYSSEEGRREFAQWERVHIFGEKLKCMCHHNKSDCHAMVPAVSKNDTKARRSALRPGGAVARRFLAQHPVALSIGSTLFVHGGLHPEHMQYGMEKINEESSAWIDGRHKNTSLWPGKDAPAPWFLSGRNSVVWSRMYSMPDESKCDCNMLQAALNHLPQANRMVVGHTVQYPFGINSACDDRVFRVDVGMSGGVCDAHPEVLEIIEDREVRRLRAYQSAQVLLPAHRAVQQARLKKQKQNAQTVQ